MSTPYAFEVTNLSKRFKVPARKQDTLREHVTQFFQTGGHEYFQVLEDISFGVHQGEFFGIIGHNGSGKSTLLKMLAGIIQQDTGTITTTGAISPFLELGVGFHPELTGRDNIYLNGTILGLTRKEIDHKIDRIIAFAELAPFIDQKLKNYSSGMQVRLAFSVAIHAEKDILLMDEVLAVGDMHFQSKCLEYFLHAKKQGKTVILVGHDLNTIQKYCDRVLLLDHGKQVMVGRPDRVCAEYVKRMRKNSEKDMDEVLEEYEQYKQEQEVQEINEQNEKLNKALEKNKKGSETIERYGSQRVSISSIDLLDIKEVPVEELQMGNMLLVRYNFVIHDSSITEAVFGIEVFSEEGERIYGTHTKKQDYVVDIAGKVFVDCVIDTSMLLPGVYLFSPAIADIYCVEQYDYISKKFSFVITGSTENEGMVDMKARW